MSDPTTAPCDPQALAQAYAVERRKGFRQGMSSALCLLSLVTSSWAIFRTHYAAPKYREVFEQVRVEMPAVTSLVLNYYWFMSVILGLVAVGCAILAWLRGGGRLSFWLNIGCFLLAAGWLAAVNIALSAPLNGLLEGVGKPPR